jgi:TerC family integral membrane protein
MSSSQIPIIALLSRGGTQDTFEEDGEATTITPRNNVNDAEKDADRVEQETSVVDGPLAIGDQFGAAAARGHSEVSPVPSAASKRGRDIVTTTPHPPHVVASQSSPATSASAVAVVLDCDNNNKNKIDVDDDAQYKTAVLKTTITVAAAGVFGAGLCYFRGVSTGMEFFAGYLVEQSLSIDNLFVFIMLFDYFRVPLNLQERVLTWGIIGAVVLRGLMIAVGVAAIQKFQFVILIFAGVLLASAFKLLTESEHGDDKNNSSSFDDNMIMKVVKFIFPRTTTDFHGEQFFWTSPKDGIKYATPLLLCLICVELSDFVFAVDSIPAVLGVSKDPLVVYASNIFAILALRSLYTIVAKAVSDLHYLRPAVALVLGFVGSKMVAEYFHYEISTGTSLLVVTGLLGLGIGASVWENRQSQTSKTRQHDTPTVI